MAEIKRKIAPFPLEIVAFHPAILALPAAGMGMLMRLLIHFWMTDLRAMPVADNELCAIARGHRPTWRHWKNEIMQIFEDVRPDLERRYHRWHHSKLALAKLAGLGGRPRKFKEPVETISGNQIPHGTQIPHAALPKRSEANQAAVVEARNQAEPSFAD